MLILLRDVAVADPVVLAAAALMESEDAAFRISLEGVREGVGDDVAAFVRAVPLPDSDTLAEAWSRPRSRCAWWRSPSGWTTLRHGHLREADAAWRRALHEQVGAVYLPLAERTHANSPSGTAIGGASSAGGWNGAEPLQRLWV